MPELPKYRTRRVALGVYRIETPSGSYRIERADNPQRALTFIDTWTVINETDDNRHDATFPTLAYARQHILQETNQSQEGS